MIINPQAVPGHPWPSPHKYVRVQTINHQLPLKYPTRLGAEDIDIEFVFTN